MKKLIQFVLNWFGIYDRLENIMVTLAQLNDLLVATKASADTAAANVTAVLALLAASEVPVDFTAQATEVQALKDEVDALNAQLEAALPKPPVEAPAEQ